MNRYYQRGDPAADAIEYIGPADTFTRDEVEAILHDREAVNDRYATTQSHSQKALNASLIQTQIVLLIAIFVQQKTITSIQIALSVFVVLFILLEILLFIVLQVKSSISSEEQLGKRFTATALNNLAAIISYILLIISFAISGLRSYSSIEPATNITSSSNML